MHPTVPLLLALALLEHADRPPPLDPRTVTIADLQALQAAGVTGPRAIVRQHLDRIAAYDRRGPALRAVQRLDPAAPAAAADLEARIAAGESPGPLVGVPVLVKESVDVAGLPTTAGSAALAGLVPPDDAAVVQRLRAAGAIVLGKGAMTEFANFLAPDMPAGYSALGGSVCNPYDPRRNSVDASCRVSPAGSSSGSAAAVAAGFVVAAIGTETAGSILKPASQNQIVGIKPTMGLVSRHGILPLSLDLDTPGPLARTVADAAAVLGVLAGYDARDPATRVCQVPGRCHRNYGRFLDANALKGARLVVPQHPYWDTLSGGQHALMHAAIETLRARGARVTWLDRPGVDLSVATRPLCTTVPAPDGCSTVVLYGFKRDFDAYLAQRGQTAQVRDLRQLVAWNLAHPQVIQYGQAIAAAAALLDTRPGSADSVRYAADRAEDMAQSRAAFAAALAGPDGVPDTKDDADAVVFPGGRGAIVASKAGQPSVTVPAGLAVAPGHDGHAPTPMGLTLTGPAFSEPKLLGLAYAFEQATRHRTPPASTPPLPR